MRMLIPPLKKDNQVGHLYVKHVVLKWDQNVIYKNFTILSDRAVVNLSNQLNF